MIEGRLLFYAFAAFMFSFLFGVSVSNSVRGETTDFLFFLDFIALCFWLSTSIPLYKEIKVYPELSFKERRDFVFYALAWPFVGIGFTITFFLIPHLLLGVPYRLLWWAICVFPFGYYFFKFPYCWYLILSHQYTPKPAPEASVDPEPQPELKQEPDERYLDWIRKHKPSLPERAKEAYLQAARLTVEKYYEERLAPTTDELLIGRREVEEELEDKPHKTLGQLQYILYDRYKTLAADYPPQSEFPDFPFFPVDARIAEVRATFFAGLIPLLPWTYEPPEGKEIPANSFSSPFDEVFELLPTFRGGAARRFEGAFILAPSGSGKTTTLNYLISHDLPYVERGEASVIVMDDRGVFLSTLLALPQFDPNTGSLRNKVTIIDPVDQPPPPLNPFALGRARLVKAQHDKKGELFNIIIDAVSHIFATFGENTGFTDRQRTLFRHCVRLVTVIPNGNLSTLNTIFTTKSVKEYERHFSMLPEISREFFETAFPTKNYQDACGEVMWRTQGVLESPEISAMLNAPSSLDFTDELNNSNVIIVNTNRNAISPSNAAVLGRLIIAMVKIAMRERDPIPESRRKPTYFYIDEAHFYIDHDDQVASMLDDVRASRLALTFVTQRLEKIKDSNVKNALLSCGILMAAPTASDASTVAASMYTDKDNLNNLPQGVFGLFARRITPFVTVKVPYTPTRTLEPDELQKRKQALWKTVIDLPPSPEPPSKNDPPPDDDDEIRPSPKL